MRHRASPAFLLVFVLGACGTNYRWQYESEVEWTRCRTLENDPNAPPADRRECWASWRQNNAAGQPPERIREAEERIAAIDNPPRRRPRRTAQNSSGGTAAPTGDQTAAGAPTPPPPPTPPMASANPPPPVAQVNPGETPPSSPWIVPMQPNQPQPTAPPPGMVQPTAMNPPANPPGFECSNNCRDGWSGCSGRCNNAAACVAACDDSYRDCMRGCY